jgi:RNA polymerase sigma factor FliA
MEIAQKLDLPLAAYQQLLGELKGLEIGTLHWERSADSEEELTYVAGRPEDDPLYRYLDGEMRDRLAKAINDLPERERLVLTLYYYEEVSMKEIGLILGITEPRVSQIRASAVLHLRARLSAPAPPEELRRRQGTKAPPQLSKAKQSGVQLPIRSTTDTHDLQHGSQRELTLIPPCCLRQRDLWN